MSGERFKGEDVREGDDKHVGEGTYPPGADPRGPGKGCKPSETGVSGGPGWEGKRSIARCDV